MNANFAKNLINAIAGKKVNVELDKDFLNMLELAYNDRIRGLEKTVLSLRFGQERVWSSTQVASHLGIGKAYAKELIDSGLRRATSSLNLDCFKSDPESQRNLCLYFLERLAPVDAYSKKIMERSAEIHRTVSFELDAHDPCTLGVETNSPSVTFFSVMLDKVCSVDLNNCPDNKIGCYCFMFAELNRRISLHIPYLMNREVNCATAERKAKLPSWHELFFCDEDLAMKLEDVGVLRENCGAEVFVKYPTVKDILAYEAAELVSQFDVDTVKVIEAELIALSGKVWGGWHGGFWTKYYS